MTRWGYIVFALLVVMVTTVINLDTRSSGNSGSSGSSRSWGSGSSGGSGCTGCKMERAELSTGRPRPLPTRGGGPRRRPPEGGPSSYCGAPMPSNISTSSGGDTSAPRLYHV